MNKLVVIFSLMASVALAGATDTPRVFFVGGGSNIKPEATNVVLEAAYAYTDSATNAVVEAFIASDPNLWANASRLVADGNYIAGGNETRYTLESNIVYFEMTDDGLYDVAVEVYTEVDNHIYPAVSEDVVGQKWGILFTTDVFDTPMGFTLYVTITPKASISSRDCKVMAYKLRRTF